jgi:hypothetical protein
VEGKEQYRVEVSNRFRWKLIVHGIDKGCSKLLDQRKKTKLRWLQDPHEINGDNLNNKRCEFSRCFRIEKRECPKDKIFELATSNKNKNFRDLYRRIN